MEGPRHLFDYQPEVPNLEAFTLFLKDIKQLEEADREVILDVVKGNKLGMLTLKIKEQALKEVSFGSDINQDDRINLALDAVEEIADMLQPDDVMEALGEEKDRLRATFEQYQ
jgi:hypothetical protein